MNSDTLYDLEEIEIPIQPRSVMAKPSDTCVDFHPVRKARFSGWFHAKLAEYGARCGRPPKRFCPSRPLSARPR